MWGKSWPHFVVNDVLVRDSFHFERYSLTMSWDPWLRIVRGGALCVLCLWALQVAGCEGSGISATWLDNQCIPGSTQVCACVGGDTGVQTCQGDGIYTYCECPEGSRPVDAGVSPEPVVEDVSTPSVVEDIGRVGADLGPDSLPEGYQGPWLRITEVMAANSATLEDEDGDSSDWVEIHNPSYEPVNLEGYHLSDDDDDLTRWTFPSVTLPAKGFVVVFASGKDRAVSEAPLHTDFKLSANGEYLALSAPDGTLLDAIDGWPPQVSDVSFGPAMTVLDDQLVAPTDIGYYLMPYGEGPTDGWPLPGWVDDADAWTVGALGIGYEDGVFSTLDEPAGDSLADWSSSGVQGAAGWRRWVALRIL